MRFDFNIGHLCIGNQKNKALSFPSVMEQHVSKGPNHTYSFNILKNVEQIVPISYAVDFIIKWPLGRNAHMLSNKAVACCLI